MDREYYADNEIQLANFDRDSIEDFFYLEEKEVKFWNRTGLRPDDIFTEYKCDYELKSQEYYNKYIEIRNKMKNIGITSRLRMQHQRYKNGDIVLVFKNSYNINNELVDDKFNKYLDNENVYLPLSNYKDLYRIYKTSQNKKIVQ